MTVLPPEQLESLRRIQSCAISNAIETFDIRPRNEGFMSPRIKCMFPKMGNMIGYAVTAVVTADSSPSDHMNVSRAERFDEVLKVPEPRVVVIKDMDYPNPVGSFWGEVQSNIHKALGCVGTVTGGGVRDLDEMQQVGFHAFASEVLVSHAYVHLVDIGVPVTVGGLLVKPGDLIMGDKHGVIGIPEQIAADIPAAAQRVEDREREIIDLCRSADFTVEKLKAVIRQR